MNISSSRSGRGRRRTPMAEINVGPYIDVTLVLLIIFMVTAPMLQTGVDVDLPQAEAKMIDPKQELPLIISIDASGGIYLDSGNQQDTAVTPDELTRQVVEALTKKPGLAVLIRGDSTVDYGKVVAIMAALKNAGVPNVGLMTRPAEE